MTALLVLAAMGQSCIQQQTAYQPVYQQQAYANYAQTEKVVFVAVEDPADYYAGLVGQQQRAAERQTQAQQTQNSTDAKLDALTRLVTELQRRLETQPNEPRQQLLPDRPSRAPATATPALPALSSEAVAPPPTIVQAASRSNGHPGLASLTKSCAACHSGSAAKGAGVVLFAANGQFVATDRDDLERIESAIVSGRMPKRAKQPLSLAEYVKIRDFLNEQAGNLALTSNVRRKTR